MAWVRQKENQENQMGLLPSTKPELKVDKTPDVSLHLFVLS